MLRRNPRPEDETTKQSVLSLCNKDIVILSNKRRQQGEKQMNLYTIHTFYVPMMKLFFRRLLFEA